MDFLRPMWGELKMPRARGSDILEGGGGPSLIICVHMRMERSLMGVQPSLDSVRDMALRNPFNREGNHSDHPL